MIFTTSLVSLVALASSTYAAVIPTITPTPTPDLSKRAQVPLGLSVWRSTLPNGAIEFVTATIVDGVTISASPASTTDPSKPTPWISIDNSGIPIAITPTIQTPGGSTVSPSPVPPSNYPTPHAIPPVLRCFGDRVPDAPAGDASVPGYPFCSPRNGTEMVVDETYWITWDPTYWGGSSIKFVKLYARSLPSRGNKDLVFSTDWISNADGFFPLKVLANYFVPDTQGYMFINMQPLVPENSDATHVGAVSGPIIRVITKPVDALKPISRLPSDNAKNGGGNNNSSGGNNGGLSKGKLAAAIVVPIVFLLILGLTILFFFRLRNQAMLRRKTEEAGKGKGVYIAKDSGLVSTRTNASTFSTISNATTATMASQTWGNNTHSGNLFHDRHAQDVELDVRKPAK